MFITSFELPPLRLSVLVETQRLQGIRPNEAKAEHLRKANPAALAAPSRRAFY